MEEGVSRGAYRERSYGMKKHHATRLHYDLRLEWNGVLLSWAIPKGPSYRPDVIRDAIEMEDHKTEYLRFEGVHSTGPIMLWDCGAWEPHAECDDIEDSLRKGILKFTLRGEKLKGAWTLIRTNSLKNAPRVTWILRKEADSFAASDTDICICEKLPNSISTGRTMEKIVEDWQIPKNRHEHQSSLFEDT
jgi:bifunctional non-homologous end joining protein LigD